MAKFCIFGETNGTEVYVNPEQVVLVRPFDEGAQIILADGTSIGVEQAADQVITLLQHASRT
ncbi:hypothetical protein NKH37_23885 [Mesorhizobium sp. M1217]|uniref:hypothetical protein n=1 Tax=Mesorhizobium sp. M1217 TaxID=2957070 RepID=UPI00333B95A9